MDVHIYVVVDLDFAVIVCLLACFCYTVGTYVHKKVASWGPMSTGTVDNIGGGGVQFSRCELNLGQF